MDYGVVVWTMCILYDAVIVISSAGQAVWVPEEGGGGGEVVCVGWENRPRKLGFVYCLNRPSALYHMHLGSGKSSKYRVKELMIPVSAGVKK